jgi:Kef-type K+ transport system membrane component KefB
MIGIALLTLFPAFNSDTNPDAWLNVYWLLAAISFSIFMFLFFAKFEKKW